MLLDGHKPKAMLHCNIDGWTQQRTADDLGISQPAVVKAIKIAEAVEAGVGCRVFMQIA